MTSPLGDAVLANANFTRSDGPRALWSSTPHAWRARKRCCTRLMWLVLEEPFLLWEIVAGQGKPPRRPVGLRQTAPSGGSLPGPAPLQLDLHGATRHSRSTQSLRLVSCSKNPAANWPSPAAVCADGGGEVPQARANLDKAALCPPAPPATPGQLNRKRMERRPVSASSAGAGCVLLWCHTGLAQACSMQASSSVAGLCTCYCCVLHRLRCRWRVAGHAGGAPPSRLSNARASPATPAASVPTTAPKAGPQPC